MLVSYIKKNWITFVVASILFWLGISGIGFSTIFDSESFWSLVLQGLGISFIITSFSTALAKILAYKEPRILEDVQFLGTRADVEEEIRYYLKISKKKIDILGINLHDFFNSTRISKFKAFVSDGRHVRILVLNPNSAYARERMLAEGAKERSISKLQQTNKQFLIELVQNFRSEFAGVENSELKKNGRLDLNMYNAYPLYSVIRTDDMTMVSPYMMMERGEESPVFVIHVNTELYQKYLVEIDHLAKNSIELVKIRSNKMFFADINVIFGEVP